MTLSYFSEATKSDNGTWVALGACCSALIVSSLLVMIKAFVSSFSELIGSTATGYANWLSFNNFSGSSLPYWLSPSLDHNQRQCDRLSSNLLILLPHHLSAAFFIVTCSWFSRQAFNDFIITRRVHEVFHLNEGCTWCLLWSPFMQFFLSDNQGIWIIC